MIGSMAIVNREKNKTNNPSKTWEIGFFLSLITLFVFLGD